MKKNKVDLTYDSQEERENNEHQLLINKIDLLKRTLDRINALDKYRHVKQVKFNLRQYEAQKEKLIKEIFNNISDSQLRKCLDILIINQDKVPAWYKLLDFKDLYQEKKLNSDGASIKNVYQESEYPLKQNKVLDMMNLNVSSLNEGTLNEVGEVKTTNSFLSINKHNVKDVENAEDFKTLRLNF